MGDQGGVANLLGALLQCPAVLTAIGAALAPFLAGAPPVTVDEGAARGRSHSKGRKGGGGSAQPPPPPPLLRQIASLEGVINTLRCQLADLRGEPAPTRPRAAAAAPAASTTAAAKAKAATPTATAAAGKAAASTSKAATTWQPAGQNHSQHSPANANAQAKQTAAAPWGSPPHPSP